MTAEYCKECGARKGMVHRADCSMPGQWTTKDLSHLSPIPGARGFAVSPRLVPMEEPPGNLFQSRLNCPSRMGLRCLAQYLELPGDRRAAVLGAAQRLSTTNYTDLLVTLHSMTGASLLLAWSQNPAAAVTYLRRLWVTDDDLAMIIEAAEALGSEDLIEALTEYRESR